MGQKYAAFDAQGNISAFYDSIDSPVPEGVQAIEINDAEWQTCISQQGQWHVMSGALAQVPPPGATQLLAQAQSAQVASLYQSCTNAIASGFTSSALGSAYTYPSTLTDQTNQNTVANCSSGGVLWCATGGAWAFKAHTQAQAQAVVAAFAAWLNKCQSQLVTLTGQINAATSVSAVEAIAWTNPQ
ncbi:hypothetical protein WJ95_20605 [Burkholderia ubonensis]|uniref:hypothetical protein n=1 Tax=Burkholderia ubonensis TaxID=101571 RepID=UPI000755F0D9|nr:hypothetical protein [Burkholderia ubonensis]KVP84563.1 hypothetical protein WJ95_20605 [Burkholderia ubonensis]